MRTGKWAALFWTWLVLALPAVAGESRFSVLLDTDNNAGTGCTISTANGAAAGIEQVATTVVTTSTTGATVTRLERQACANGTLGTAVVYDGGGWAVGLGNGTGGTAAVETSIPLTLLPASGTMKALVTATAGAGQDATAPFLIALAPATTIPVVPVPLSPWLVLPLSLFLLGVVAWWHRRHPGQTGSLVLLILVAGTGLVWAASVLRDGNVGDWAGVTPAVTDAAGDAPINADVVAVFTQQDGTNLYLRIDADVRKDATTNQSPSVSAGSNQSITLPATANLTGSATDDGLPNPPAALTTAWSKVSGPGTVNFANAAALSTTATFGAAGSYVLRLTASDSLLASSADVTITVNAASGVNQAPQVNAGANQSITLPAVANLTGSANDDGLPNPPAALTYAWTKVSGPGTVIFGNAANAVTTASFGAAGSYSLRLTASDSALAGAADVAITVNDTAPAGPQVAPIADQTIALGARFQQLVQATAPNINEVLTFALPTAPTGAALSPAPLIDWLPTAAQVGVNAFTARVTDGQGQTATTTFNVTVTHVNQPPQLQPQANATVNIGSTFGRTLVATDPDAGDTLTYSLVAGPSGMTLTGASLSWPTTGQAVGDYAASVKVTDGGGLSDVKPFTLSLRQAVAPVANDDRYEVNLGQSLTIPAPGVLANDLDPMGGGLTAAKLTDADKGTLSVFNADGSFTFQAPAVIGKTFQPVVKWISQSNIPGMTMRNNLRAVDVDGDGKPELVIDHPSADIWGEYGLSVLHGKDGSVLWGQQTLYLPLPPPNDQCVIVTWNAPDVIAVGDIDDSGAPAIIVPVVCPNGPAVTGGPTNRLAALDARTGAVKWLSPMLSPLREVAGTPGYAFDITNKVRPAIARLRPGETPSVLFKRTMGGDDRRGAYYCNDYLPGVSSSNCTVVTAVDGATGAVRQVWAAFNDYYSPGNEQGGFVLVADLNGSGTPNIIADTAVWDLNGTLLNNRSNGRVVVGLALANLDDSGETAIISFEIASGGMGYVVARKPAGQMLWETPTDLNAGSVSGQVVVADLFGDGMPKTMVTSSGNLYVYDERGALAWTHRFADAANNPTIANHARPVVFDLDGDGVSELIMQTGYGVEIFDGKTGAVKANVRYTDVGYPDTHPYQSSSSGLTPLVIDADGDGHAEVVFNIVSPIYPLKGWVVALKSANDDWQPARPVWNQFAMHDANVTDTGHIPYPEANNFATPRTNVFANPARIAPDVDPRKREQATFTYKAQAGGLDSNPATVTIDIMPTNRPPVFTSTPPNTYITYNNSYPAIIPFVYQSHAVDPDPGDTITYSIVLRSSSSWTFTINATTGRIEVPILAGNSAGPLTFVIAATDSFGESAYQTFTLYPSTGLGTVPNVVGQSRTTADATLTAAGFATGNVSSVYFQAPIDQVLTQFPAAGASVLKGEAIALQVSLGPQPVPLPNLVGLSLTEAQTQLTGLGFTVVINAVSSSTVPASQVFGQSPAFGTELTPLPGNPVTLTASIGPPLTGTVAQVIVEPAPSATRIVGETVAYRATAVYTDGTATDVTLRSLWNTSTPAVASVDGTGSAHALTAGATTISATAGGKTGQATFNVVARAAGDATTPVAAMTAPADGATMTGPTDIIGTASDANFLRYELAYAPAGETTWTVIGEGTSPVTAGTLGTFDPTVLLNDLYTLRLTVVDRGGNETVTTRTVQVQGNAKPGLFTLTYQDLSVPMTGLPITVRRTYDSRDKAKGDFGIGWRQGFNTIRLRTNRVPGTGWVRSLGALAVVTLTPTSAHKVSVTLPDGKVEEFDLVLAPTSGFGGLDATTVVGYAPRPGTVGSLALLDNPNLWVVNGGAEDELVDDITFDTFNPSHYRYTTLDGTQIELGPQTGVTRITDRNGNRVTFGRDGIVHSSGKSVLFTRDGQGRITQITDPLGNAQTYAYDGNGDLMSHTSATGDISRYRYDRQHNLIDVQDPAGNHAARNDYDAAGRLTAITDAKGNQVTYTHNLGASTELVRDRLGNPTLYAYDAMGNVVTQTSALGHVTSYTYDGRNNQLTSTDPLGRVSSKSYDAKDNLLTSTDFEGNTTTLTYNANGQVLTRTDPEGRTTTNIYDANGNLTQVTDPEGGVTRLTYDGSGRRLSTADPLGNVTSFTYDAVGNTTAQTDPLGRTTTYTYDANGRVLGQTDPDGKTSPRAYDAAGRIVGITNKLGQKTLIGYSNTGGGQKIATRTDALGRVTRLDYDSIGNLTTTTFPDGSLESTTYDLENHPLSKTDRDARTTSFQYDALGRQTRITYPDGTATLQTYDAAGRVATQTDERGNTTTYAYAPNQQTITDTIGNATTHLFESQSRRVKTTDALGHVARFAFDSAGNPTKITFPDGSFKTIVYDAARRRTAETDQAGVSTQFAYDAAGNLLRVTDANGGVTSHTYDALGNRLTQTDANGHTTQMRYDALGQMVARTLPSGKQETFVYDAVGNQVAHTDFNGRTTTFAYDAVNQMTQKSLPSGSTVTYAYNGAGLRTNAAGDSYVYDARDRLLEERKASGETLAYTYDATGNKTSVTTLQGTTTYRYDALNRLAAVIDATGTIAYSYDAMGNQASMAYPNGVTATYNYDTLNRLLKVTNSGPGGGLISSYAYTYGSAGNRIQVVEAGPATTGRTVRYTFDPVYRLIQEQITESPNPVVTISYSYDAVGNRTRMDRNGVVTAYTYDTSDRLITEVKAASTFTSSYDDNGNSTSRSDGVNTDSYVYDAENRLVSATTPSGTVTYTYDADGMRTSKTAGGFTTTYLLDKTREDAQVLVEKSGATVATYTYGHQLIGQARPSEGVHFYLADGQLSTRQLTDMLGVVTDSYSYDAFGVQSRAAGSTTNAYLYTGEQFDPDLSFYYLRARYYSQAAGRFISTDPHEGDPFEPVSLHRYLYANGDPVGMHDPSGREPTLASVLSASAIGAGIGATSATVGIGVKLALGQPVTLADAGRAIAAGALIGATGAAVATAATAWAGTTAGVALGAAAAAVGNTANALLLIHKNRDVTERDVELQLGFYAGVSAGGLIGGAVIGDFSKNTLRLSAVSGGNEAANQLAKGATRVAGISGGAAVTGLNAESKYAERWTAATKDNLVVWRRQDRCPKFIYSAYNNGKYDVVGSLSGTACNLVALVVDIYQFQFGKYPLSFITGAPAP